nr:MAG TPA: hypothetical protein [Caudoviricetes sp.]
MNLSQNRKKLLKKQQPFYLILIQYIRKRKRLSRDLLR